MMRPKLMKAPKGRPHAVSLGSASARIQRKLYEASRAGMLSTGMLSEIARKENVSRQMVGQQKKSMEEYGVLPKARIPNKAPLTAARKRLLAEGLVGAERIKRGRLLRIANELSPETDNLKLRQLLYRMRREGMKARK